MGDALDIGHAAIAAAIDKKPAILIEMTRQFGDILHSTLVVRHYRKQHPNHRVVWAISARYVDVFASFTPDQLGPHAIAPLPDLPAFPEDGPARIAWVKEAGNLPDVKAIGCGVHPWGWACGDIVTAILHNAGIQKLCVPRRPWAPLEQDDLAWAEDFILKHGLQGGFVALEYVSHSLGSQPPALFASLARQLPVPTVSLAAASDPLVPGTIDGRGSTFRQAKALIARSLCFVGCGSGLSVLATSEGCEQPMVEFVGPGLSAVGIGYRPKGPRNVCLRWSDDAAEAIRRFVPKPEPKRRRLTARERAKRRMRKAR